MTLRAAPGSMGPDTAGSPPFWSSLGRVCRSSGVVQKLGEPVQLVVNASALAQGREVKGFGRQSSWLGACRVTSGAEGWG